jgi:hypothetical protein
LSILRIPVLLVVLAAGCGPKATPSTSGDIQLIDFATSHDDASGATDAAEEGSDAAPETPDTLPDADATAQPDAAGPCAGITCSGNGVCTTKSGAAACFCFLGYVAVPPSNQDCIPNPCTGVACSGRGECYLDGITPKCTCERHYKPDGPTCKPMYPFVCDRATDDVVLGDFTATMHDARWWNGAWRVVDGSQIRSYDQDGKPIGSPQAYTPLEVYRGELAERDGSLFVLYAPVDPLKDASVVRLDATLALTSGPHKVTVWKSAAHSIAPDAGAVAWVQALYYAWDTRRFTLLDGDGAPIDPPSEPESIAGDIITTSVARGAKSYLATWTGWCATGQRYDLSGQPLGNAFDFPSACDERIHPEATWANGKYLVAWFQAIKGGPAGWVVVDEDSPAEKPAEHALVIYKSDMGDSGDVTMNSAAYLSVATFDGRFGVVRSGGFYAYDTHTFFTLVAGDGAQASIPFYLGEGKGMQVLTHSPSGFALVWGRPVGVGGGQVVLTRLACSPAPGG